MSDRQRELQLHAAVSELLAYLNVDQEPQKFLDLISNKKQYSSKVVGLKRLKFIS
jgi:hypothetical protein